MSSCTSQSPPWLAPTPTSPTRWVRPATREAEADAIKAEVAHYVDVRDEVKLGAGEDVDFKQYEAGMRYLLDTYIQANPSETVSNFEDTGLIDLIVKLGAGAIDKLPEGIKKDPEAVAETITNNIRKVIIDERADEPEVLRPDVASCSTRSSRNAARAPSSTRQYLAQAARTRRQVGKGESDTDYPDWADNGAQQGPGRLLRSGRRPGHRRSTTSSVTTKPDSWVGNTMKERLVKQAITTELPDDFDADSMSYSSW